MRMIFTIADLASSFAMQYYYSNFNLLRLFPMFFSSITRELLCPNEGMGKSELTVKY